MGNGSNAGVAPRPSMAPVAGKKAGGGRRGPRNSPHKALVTHVERVDTVSKCQCCHYRCHLPRSCSGCGYSIPSLFVFLTTMGHSGARLPTQQCCDVISKNFLAVDSPAGKIPKGNTFSSSDFKCPEMAHAVSFYPTPLLPCRLPCLLPGTV